MCNLPIKQLVHYNWLVINVEHLSSNHIIYILFLLYVFQIVTLNVTDNFHRLNAHQYALNSLVERMSAQLDFKRFCSVNFYEIS